MDRQAEPNAGVVRNPSIFNLQFSIFNFQFLRWAEKVVFGGKRFKIENCKKCKLATRARRQSVVGRPVDLQLFRLPDRDRRLTDCAGLSQDDLRLHQNYTWQKADGKEQEGRCAEQLGRFGAS